MKKNQFNKDFQIQIHWLPIILINVSIESIVQYVFNWWKRLLSAKNNLIFYEIIKQSLYLYQSEINSLMFFK